ncbi:Aspartate/glutamate/uridylate kinase [Aspergillus egyptiacus]|nr:Aspartate/glutamate/uridylate kinase [Aspergillus egyptiacus]
MASERLTIVIKLGTSSIVDENTHEPILSILTLIVETAAKLHRDGHNVVLVSSGAVGVGLRRMDVDERPTYLPRIQALAAVGQCRLMSLWDGLFSHLRLPVAQILLTRNDIADRTQYLNAQNTFEQLFDMGVIPIVNENDTLAVSEIKFGDNDTLSAITAAMVKADYLFLMTDVDCLYTANPRTNPNAQPIEIVSDISSLAADVSSAGSSLGTGGMSTKITAAKLGTSAGVTTIITKSSKPGNIHEIVRYLQGLKQTAAAEKIEPEGTFPTSQALRPPLHTRFVPSETPVQSRSFWLLHGLKPHGTIYIDRGAYAALQKKAGLLPAGVVEVDGHFGQQEAVRLVVLERMSPDALNGDFLHHGQEPKEVGRALVNYGSLEIAKIKGHRSTHIQSLLGYADSEYVALRENISFFGNDEAVRR